MLKKIIFVELKENNRVMKKIFYLFAAVLMVFSLESCKRVQDENGDLLSNADGTDSGLDGERKLYREYEQGQLVKQYNYDQRKLMEVLEPTDSARTTIEYNQNRINSLTYTRVYNGDSTSYKRLYYYNELGKVNEIKERRVFKPANQDILNVFQSLYMIEYDADKITSILMKTGQEIAQQDFAFTAYYKAMYEYEGENVIGQTKVFGMMNGEELGGVNSRSTYQYDNYDDKISPYTLIPFDYKISQVIDFEAEAYRFSPNNVRKITFSSTQNPVPVTITTLFTYDSQNYGLLGFGKMFDYRPL